MRGGLGLFGSRTRPGLKGPLGSLTGSSLGDSTPVTASPTVTVTPVAAPSFLSTLSTPVKLGGAALAAWYLFFRRK
jgi:hypothetical protein